ncbi:MAG: carbohydrate ABC transporter permease [Anaerolineae bacterium]|nr:carbohydrate ABC transporter permease [Anaerolineae bacterium]
MSLAAETSVRGEAHPTIGTRRYVTKLGFAVLVITTCIAVAYPFYWMVMGSFIPEGYAIANAPVFLPEQLTLDTYSKLFTERPIWLWIGNTLLVTVGSTLVSIPLSILAAYSLNRYRFWGRKFFILFILMMQLLPATAIIVPFFISFRNYGLLNTLPGVGIAYITFTLPLGIWILWGYFQSIPLDFEEAALVDGCTPMGAFLRVTLPLAMPGVAATAMFIFLDGWNQYLLAYVLTSTSDKWVISLGLFSFIGEYFVEIEQMMAAAVVASLPALVVFAILQRFLRGGLSLGGMKG